MPKFEINAFPLVSSIEKVREKNLDYAKRFIKDKGASFAPTMFVMTKKAMYYVQLDTEVAEETRSSPLDQVEAIVKTFLKLEDKFGKVTAYQVIGEAWMKSFRQESGVPPMAYGDIAKMADRVEILMEAMVRKGKDRSFRTFEIMREENTDKVIEFKKMTGMSSMSSDKFPIIPNAKDSWTGNLRAKE